MARRNGAQATLGPPHIGAASPRRRQESRRTTLVSTLVLLSVLVAAFLLAPLLTATPFWQEHFPGHESRTGLLLYAPLLIASALSRTWRPLTWESELLARGLRNLAHATLLWWLLDPLLEAPRLAALAAFPLLLATPLLALHVTRTGGPLTPEARRPLLTTAVAATTTSVLIPAILWSGPTHWLLALLAIPLAAVHTALLPHGAHRARSRLTAPAPEGPAPTRDTPEPHTPMDLPPGTLHPPASPLRLVLTIGGLLLVLLIIAPGLPLSATIAWGALVIALPLVLHAIITRGGTADPRLLVGPATMRRHESRVLTIADESLEEIDEAVERFLRWGTGRKELAEKISTLLQQADEEATPEHLETRLARLPRRPWARRAREDGLVTLLRPREARA